ncbi:MAG TPA: hypothetical protein VMW47_07535 [Verrucomicrobiae bacterium]|nr:hypothetical protein [Verrucomicrobiae bacterium]
MAVLWQRARPLEVVPTIAGVVGGRGRPSVGEYLLLAALNRAVGDPCSKPACADWSERTRRTRLLPVPAGQLSSQRVWDARDQVDGTAVQTLFHQVAQRARTHVGVQDQVVAVNTTNYVTSIASDNGRPTLPQRGHSQAKRHDVRQVGRALAVTQRDQRPLFHEVDAGNRTDAATVDALVPQLLRELSDVGQGR